MPAQLLSLNEQLLNLKVVYEHAVFSDMPLADIKKISNQIKTVEKLIAERKEFIRRNELKLISELTKQQKAYITSVIPVELHMLKEKLQRLNLLYDNAKMNSSAEEVIQKIKEQIDKMHDQITEMNKTVERTLGTN
jgi:hypothetical protein